jgi:hypothetical protein
MKHERIRALFGDMPPLDHNPGRFTGEEFKFENSEVLQYAMRNEKFLSTLMSLLRDSKAIIFDRETMLWRGFRTPLSHAKTRRQNEPSSNPSILTTEPSSKYQYPYVIGGIGYVCDDRLSPNPLTAVVRNNNDDKNGQEVQP